MGRLVHLGFGNFHRAHQAWYTARANEICGTDWRYTGVAMRRGDLVRALAPSGGAYTLAACGADGLTVTRIDLHDRLLVAAEDPGAVIAELASPEVTGVTLTITEKGYCLGIDGHLDLDDPAIAADLAAPLPRTAIGLLAHGLARRRTPITVLSCDNLPGNGTLLHQAVRAYANAAGLEPRAPATFPDTMVDRITPATTDAIRAEVSHATGRTDAEPVLTEAFSEWVIAEDFASPLPDWAAAGAVITGDVGAYEARKLLMLNAAHSMLAYAGLLKGHVYVHEAVGDPELGKQMEALWDEAARQVPAKIQDTLPGYRSDLKSRFAVPEMRHRLDQIATDGSRKMPVRVAPILRALGRDAPAAASTVGAWIAYLHRFAGSGVMASDPAGERLVALARSAALTDLVREAVSALDLAEMPADVAEMVQRAADAASSKT